MAKIYMIAFCLIVLISCSGEEETEDRSVNSNKTQTEKAINEPPRVINNRISIKRQFIPDETFEQFILDYRGESFKDAFLNFVILNKNKDTLFSRTNIRGKDIIGNAEDVDLSSDDKKIEFIYNKMSTFFSLKNFSCPPYTINDPNSESFLGDVKIWHEIENDSNATCFEFSLLPDGGSEVLVYSRLLDSILVYDRTE